MTGIDFVTIVAIVAAVVVVVVIVIVSTTKNTPATAPLKKHTEFLDTLFIKKQLSGPEGTLDLLTQIA